MWCVMRDGKAAVLAVLGDVRYCPSGACHDEVGRAKALSAPTVTAYRPIWVAV